MAASERPIIETRHDQMFPVLEPAEIDRLRRFGEPRAYGAGERLSTTGEIGPGMLVILAGKVVITQRDELADHEPIVTYGPGSFLGELAQLSGRPSLVDGQAQGAVEVLVIPPQRLRDLLVGEAELGERIMRALILRRVGLLEAGAGGPVIVGRAGHVDVLRLEGFLARNGHPHQRLDPETDPGAKAILERFHLDPSSAPGRRVSPRRSMQRPRVFRCSCWIAAPLVARRARPPGSKTIWAFPPESRAWR